jgi:hypothetical protein
MKFYSWIYYGFYSILLRSAYGEVAGYMATLLLSFFCSVYFVGLTILAGVQPPEFLRGINSWLLGVFLVLPFFVANAITFLWKRRYSTIASEYAHESLRSRRTRELAVVAIMLFSFIFLALVA